jgi:hypothetical protein
MAVSTVIPSPATPGRSTVRKIRTFLSSKATLTRGEYLGEIEYPQWPIPNGYEVHINGKVYEVISSPASDTLMKMPKVLYKGQPTDETPEPVVLVAECPVPAAGQFQRHAELGAAPDPAA